MMAKGAGGGKQIQGNPCLPTEEKAKNLGAAHPCSISKVNKASARTFAHPMRSGSTSRCAISKSGVERRIWKFSKGASTGEPSLAGFGGVVFQGEAKAGKSDTVSTGIHPLARRARKGSPQPAVNICAAPMKNRSVQILPSEYNPSGGIAPHGARSGKSYLTKVTPSSPARAAAPVPKSERTIAREAPSIRLTYDSATMPKKKGKTMKEWQSISIKADARSAAKAVTVTANRMSFLHRDSVSAIKFLKCCDSARK
jgi:hypothetical protein